MMTQRISIYARRLLGYMAITAALGALALSVFVTTQRAQEQLAQEEQQRQEEEQQQQPSGQPPAPFSGSVRYQIDSEWPPLSPAAISLSVLPSSKSVDVLLLGTTILKPPTGESLNADSAGSGPELLHVPGAIGMLQEMEEQFEIAQWVSDGVVFPPFTWQLPNFWDIPLLPLEGFSINLYAPYALPVQPWQRYFLVFWRDDPGLAETERVQHDMQTVPPPQRDPFARRRMLPPRPGATPVTIPPVLPGSKSGVVIWHPPQWTNSPPPNAPPAPAKAKLPPKAKPRP